MTSRALTALAGMAVFTSLASRASAQLPTSGMVLEIDDRTVQNSGVVYINRTECSSTFEFDITLPAASGGMSGAMVPVVEAWAGPSGTDCSQGMNRKSTTGAGATTSACWRVGSITDTIMVGTSFPMDIDGDDIFDLDRKGDGCDPGRGTKYVLYFVALERATVPGEPTPPEPLSTVAKHSGTFTLYSSLPNPPTGLKGRTGESQVGASWTDTPAGTVTAYYLYGDVGSGGGSAGGDAGTVECGSGELVAGAAPPSTSTPGVYRSARATTSSAAIGNLAERGVEIGESVALAATTVDIAGNESVLSNVVCVERVNTRGFWEACASDANCNDDFETCSAAPWRTTGAFVSVALASLAIVLVRRRRRNV